MTNPDYYHHHQRTRLTNWYISQLFSLCSITLPVSYVMLYVVTVKERCSVSMLNASETVSTSTESNEVGVFHSVSAGDVLRQTTRTSAASRRQQSDKNIRRERCENTGASTLKELSIDGRLQLEFMTRMMMYKNYRHRLTCRKRCPFIRSYKTRHIDQIPAASDSTDIKQDPEEKPAIYTRLELSVESRARESW